MQKSTPNKTKDNYKPNHNSFWLSESKKIKLAGELTKNIHCENLVIGAGFTGLSCAYQLRAYNREVVVLEADAPGFGASGRNGGFCCQGSSVISYSALEKKYGLEQTQQFINLEKQGFKFVKKIIDKEKNIISNQCELKLFHKPSSVKFHKRYVEELNKYNVGAKYLNKENLIKEGFDIDYFYAAVKFLDSYGIQPYKYLQLLLKKCLQKKIKIYDHCPALKYEYKKGKHFISTRFATISCDNLILAMNAYADTKIFPMLSKVFMQAVSSIMVSEKIPKADLEAQGIKNTNTLYISEDIIRYFRLLPSGRILLGGRGGSNDSIKEINYRNKIIRANFEKYFPLLKKYKTEYSWHGMVAYTVRSHPFLGALNPSKKIFSAFGYHGNGVAFSGIAGTKLAALIVNDIKSIKEIPLFLTLAPRKFPFNQGLISKLFYDSFKFKAKLMELTEG